jgi:hypothetical protein
MGAKYKQKGGGEINSVWPIGLFLSFLHIVAASVVGRLPLDDRSPAQKGPEPGRPESRPKSGDK